MGFPGYSQVPPRAELATVAFVSGDRTGGSKPLPSPNSGTDEHDALEELDEAPTPVAPMSLPRSPEPPSPEPSETRRPNLEPITDEAHPPQNRRIPTQPPTALVLDVDHGQVLDVDHDHEPASEPSKPASLASPKPYARQSPAPVRRGLFSSDRPTNLLAGVAVGLLLALFPAKKLAESYETREVEPRLADLETSVGQTLAVEAGLVESPESVVAAINDGRKRARRRFMLVWLLAGVPIGLGLGLAPRPGE